MSHKRSQSNRLQIRLRVSDFAASHEFQLETHELLRQISTAGSQLSDSGDKLRYIAAALRETPGVTEEHYAQFRALEKERAALIMRLSGDPARKKLDESISPSISGRVRYVSNGHWDTRQNPTATQRESIEIARDEFVVFQNDLNAYLEAFELFEAELERIGAPYTKGRG